MLVLAIAAATVLVVPAGAAEEVAREELGGSVLTLVPRGEYKSARLHVTGPEGFSLTRELAGPGAISVDLLGGDPKLGDQPLLREGARLSDGQYHYEVELFDQQGARSWHGGTFFAEGGGLVSLERHMAGIVETTAGPAGAAEQRGGGGGDPDDGGLTPRVPGENFDQFVGIVDANSSNNVRINMFNVGFPDMGVHLLNGTLRLRTGVASATGTPHLTAVSSTGHVGVGTISPTHRLTVQNDAINVFRLIGPNSFGHGARFNFGDSDFVFIEEDLDDRLRIHSLGRTAFTGGRVGIGTLDPLTRLFVTGDSSGPSETQIQVRSTSAVTAPRQMLGYVNNGPPSMAFTDTSINQTWLISSLANGQFVIKPSGPVNAMRIAPNGNVFIAGTLTQGSSRVIKEAIEPVDSNEVLEKLAALPVATWQYKGTEDGDRHLGPMAEDFRSVFGLGASDAHLAPADVAGVALAAIQALHAENQDLRSRLAALEELVLQRTQSETASGR